MIGLEGALYPWRFRLVLLLLALMVGSVGAQDGRALRRYRRRWTVERTFAWLGNFRRLVVRYDRSLKIYQAFFHIACFMIVLRRVLK